MLLQGGFGGGGFRQPSQEEVNQIYEQLFGAFGGFGGAFGSGGGARTTYRDASGNVFTSFETGAFGGFEEMFGGRRGRLVWFSLQQTRVHPPAFSSMSPLNVHSIVRHTPA